MYNTARHNAARDAAIAQIRSQVAHPNDVIPGTIRIPGASQDRRGSVGIPDIIYTEGNDVYIWEVKGSVSPSRVPAQGALAAAVAHNYVQALQNEFNNRHTGQRALPGFALNKPVNTTFAGPFGLEDLTVSNGPGPGAIVYSSTPRPQPKPKPAPQPEPEPRLVPVPTAEPGPVPLPPGQTYPAPAPNPAPGPPMPTPANPGGAPAGGGWNLPSVPALSPQQQTAAAGGPPQCLCLPSHSPLRSDRPPRGLAGCRAATMAVACGAVKPLDVMLAEFVTPVLHPAGFRKTGRTYRLAAENLSQALITFQHYALSPLSRTGFIVDVGVVVEALRAWMHDRITPSSPYPSRPSIHDSFWHDVIWAPDDVAHRIDEYRSVVWYFDDADGAARCGRHLTRIFTEETVPFLTRMLDRGEQLRVLHDPDIPQAQVRVGSNYAGEILFRVDDGPSAELDAALAEAERQGSDEVVSWARTRLDFISPSPPRAR